MQIKEMVNQTIQRTSSFVFRGKCDNCPLYGGCPYSNYPLSSQTFVTYSDALRAAWGPILYYKLIRIAADIGDRDLVLLMLSEMKRCGFNNRGKLYQQLLQMISQPRDLGVYLPVSPLP